MPCNCWPELLGAIDPAAVQEYLLLQYVQAPRTIYHNVQKLEPGTFLHLGFDARTTRLEREEHYFRFEATRAARLLGEA